MAKNSVLTSYWCFLHIMVVVKYLKGIKTLENFEGCWCYFKTWIHRAIYERLWNNYTLPKSGKLLNFCQPNHISKLDRYFSFPSRFTKTAGYTESCSHQSNQLLSKTKVNSMNQNADVLEVVNTGCTITDVWSSKKPNRNLNDKRFQPNQWHWLRRYFSWHSASQLINDRILRKCQGFDLISE